MALAGTRVSACSMRQALSSDIFLVFSLPSP